MSSVRDVDCDEAGEGVHRRFAIAGTVLCLLGAVPFAPAAAGQCLVDFRQVAIAGGKSVNLRDCYCRSGRSSGGPSVRVQFHRLTDVAAAALLDRALPDRLERVLGRPRTIDASVLREFKILTHKFGSIDKYAFCEEIVVASVRGGRGASINNRSGGLGCTGIRHVRRSLGGWGKDYSKIMPQLRDLLAFRRGRGQPVGYRRISDTRYWRYVTWQDLSSFDNNMSRYNRLVGGTGKPPDLLPDHIRMPRFVTRDSLPKDFIAVYGSYSECGEIRGWSLNYYGRSLLVDVAIVSNTSDRAITIGSVAGSRATSRRLQPVAESRRLRTAGARNLGIGSMRPASGERVVLFLRQAFVASDQERGSAKNARRKPRHSTYVHGPEIRLAPLTIDDESCNVKWRSANFLKLSATAESGCCPYLYAWQIDHRRWVRQPNIIHRAQGPQGERTETREFEGYVPRFRITEEEPELTWVDQVEFSVECRNGETLQLRPAQAALALRDRHYAKLYFGDALRIDFALPAGRRTDEVVRSRLAVTGYYRRYRNLLQMRLSGPGAELPHWAVARSEPGFDEPGAKSRRIW